MSGNWKIACPNCGASTGDVMAEPKEVAKSICKLWKGPCANCGYDGIVQIVPAQINGNDAILDWLIENSVKSLFGGKDD